MTEYQTLKIKLHEHLQKLIRARIKTAEDAIQSAKLSRDGETKSSAGDKYETGRAMMHLEVQKNEKQVEKAIYLNAILQSIKDNQRHVVAKLGSLVVTDRGFYFLSIGLGKVRMLGNVYFAISVESPIGQLLVGKGKGDTVVQNGKEITIEDIV